MRICVIKHVLPESCKIGALSCDENMKIISYTYICNNFIEKLQYF